MSDLAALTKTLDLVIRLTDMVSAGTIGVEEYKESVSNINEKIKRARSEGRDLTWDEVDESQNELDDAIAKAQGMHGPAA